jgi:hypothetical protein
VKGDILFLKRVSFISLLLMTAKLCIKFIKRLLIENVQKCKRQHQTPTERERREREEHCLVDKETSKNNSSRLWHPLV